MIDRRRFLGLGAGGALAAAIRPLGGSAQEARPELRKVKSVIWLWMGGGPSQLDTWDPKPDSPNGGGVRAIETAVPGIRISEFLPLCASQMERLSILRTVTTPAASHEQAEVLMHCGSLPSCWDTDVSLGSILAYDLWNRESGAPPFVAIDPPRIPDADAMGRDFLPVPVGDLRPEPVHAGGPERRALLAEQETDWAATRKQQGVARLSEARARMGKRAASRWEKALRLDDEPEALKQAYGGRFGQSCLRARRLIQAGVAVVELGLHGWDTHEHHLLRTRKLCGSLDAGLGTLVRDLAEKDLLKDTVVICLGEFGRTPTLHAAGGRDHWTNAFSVVMAGGALTGGRVYGETGADGLACIKPVPVQDLFATLFRACGVNFHQSYAREGRKTVYVPRSPFASAQPGFVRELF